MTRLLWILSAVTLALTGCKKDLVCPGGETDCGGTCFNLAGDPANCGACGHACGALQQCEAGVCACKDGATACGTACIDTAIDPQNCGTCGTACGGATPQCAGAGPGCVAACPAGTATCGTSCPDLQASTSHCGACDHACAPGQACLSGVCAANVYAACYWTHEVKPLTRALRYGGPSIDLGTASPMRLGLSGTTLLVAAGYPQASLSYASVSGSSASRQVQLPGSDLEGLAVSSGVALVTNAWVGTLEILALDGTVLDELPMPDQQSFPNPQGVAVAGTQAYVTLNGVNKIAHVDLSGLAACQADAGATACGAGGTCAAADRHCVGNLCKLRCATVSSVIDLAAVPGAADPGALPLPSAVAVSGGKVYVTLSNLSMGHVSCDGFSWDGFAVPSGPGLLARIDPDAADSITIASLGSGCRSPSDVVARGTQLWVSCGSYCFGDVAPGAVTPVDVSGATPVVGTPRSIGAAIGGQLALCGTDGYVADQRKTGAVVRFAPDSTAAPSAVTICGADAHDNALVSDLVCYQ